MIEDVIGDYLFKPMDLLLECENNTFATNETDGIKWCPWKYIDVNKVKNKIIVSYIDHSCNNESLNDPKYWNAFPQCYGNENYDYCSMFKYDETYYNTHYNNGYLQTQFVGGNLIQIANLTFNGNTQHVYYLFLNIFLYFSANLIHV